MNKKTSSGGKITLKFSKAERQAVLPTLNEDYEPTVPARPTKEIPGTWEKIQVLEYRLSNGMPLHVEGDSVFDMPIPERPFWAGKIMDSPLNPKTRDRVSNSANS